MPIGEGKIAKLESNADNVTFLTHPHLRDTTGLPSIGLKQKGHDETHPRDLGSEDADKQPSVEQQSKDAARRRQEEEQHQLKFSPAHHRIGDTIDRRVSVA